MSESAKAKRSAQLPKRRFIRILITVLAVIALDQLTKSIIVQHIPRGSIVPVIPGFFDLTLTYNMGAAFGIFSGLSDSIRSYVLLATTVLAFGVVLFYMRTSHGRVGLSRFAFALIMGGALGNLIDRLRLGKVVDFLDVYVGTYHWPAFNVADSCICIGVMLLILAPSPKPKDDEEEEEE